MSGRKSPQKRAIRRSAGNTRFAETGWWCAQSYSNPSQRRFHTGNRGNPLFSAFFSQNGEFKSKGFRFPCVLSVGFRAMWRPATARGRLGEGLRLRHHGHDPARKLGLVQRALWLEERPHLEDYLVRLVIVGREGQ